MTCVITAPCIDVKDETCVDECPVDCTTKASGCSTPTRRVRRLWRLRAGLPGQGDLLRTRRPRPMGAVHPENARFFDQLRSPGGASKTGALPYDTDYLASYVTSR